jgi:hypothetical protein
MPNTENEPRKKDFFRGETSVRGGDVSTKEDLKLDRSIVLNEIEDFEELVDFDREIPLRKFVRSAGTLKRVYRQALDFGALPNTTVKNVDFPEAVPVALVDDVIYFMAISVVSGGTHYANSWHDGTNATYWGANFAGTNLRAICGTDWDASTINAKVVVEYTRTDR